MKRLFSLFMLLLVAVLLVACGDPEPEEDLDPVTLNVSINYTAQGELFPITYRQADPYVSSVNGQTYVQGDLTPSWEKIAEITNTTFNDVAQAADANTNAQWERLIGDGFSGVDLVNGTGQLIGVAGTAGSFVDLGQHLDSMPNLKALLDSNPSLNTGLRTGDGGLYFTPYFDGLNELEHMFMARIDWIEKVLDWDSESVLSTDAYVVGTSYELVTPAGAEAYSVTVANATGGTRVVEKDRDENILVTLRGLTAPTGKDLAVALVEYLEDTYGGLEDSGYAKWSDVFAGSDASYDTDELMALIHVVRANESYLLEGTTGMTQIDGYFARETAGNRIRQMFRGLEMFGLRGVGSRLEWTFIDSDGELKDVRGDEDYRDDFIAGVNNLSNMVQDGLIMTDHATFPIQNIRRSVLNGEHGRLGFLTYDYNASTTVFGNVDGADPDFKFQAILPPAVEWRGDGEYFHFSESNRSVKNEAWGIPSHVAEDADKLARALLIVDGMFDYSSQDSIGTIHLYGPAGWTTGETIAYGEDIVYELSQAFFDEMADKGLTHIDYLRRYIGATMPIGHIRSLGLEFQTLSEDGVEGIERINTAQAAGVLKIAGLVDSDDSWFNLVPTFLPFESAENQTIAANGTWRDNINNDSLMGLMNHGFSGDGGTITEAAWKAALDDQYPLYSEAFSDAYARALANS